MSVFGFFNKKERGLTFSPWTGYWAYVTKRLEKTNLGGWEKFQPHVDKNHENSLVYHFFKSSICL